MPAIRRPNRATVLPGLLMVLFIVPPGGLSPSTLAVRPLASRRRNALSCLLKGVLGGQARRSGAIRRLSRDRAAQPARSADSRAAATSLRHSRSTQARPFSPMARARAGSARSSARRCGAGAADRQRGARRLQVDDAETFRVEPAAAGPAGHGEHVGRIVVAGELGPRD